MSVATEKQDLKRGVDYIGVNCVFICHDGEGNVLLQKRAATCRDEAGVWDCGGGAMEHGETFEDTVRREVLEEYLAEVLEIEHVTTMNVLRNNNGTPTHWIANVHLVRVNPETAGIGEPHKVDAVEWFHVDALPENLHTMLPSQITLVRDRLMRES